MITFIQQFFSFIAMIYSVFVAIKLLTILYRWFDVWFDKFIVKSAILLKRILLKFGFIK